MYSYTYVREYGNWQWGNIDKITRRYVIHIITFEICVLFFQFTCPFVDKHWGVNYRFRVFLWFVTFVPYSFRVLYPGQQKIFIWNPDMKKNIKIRVFLGKNVKIVEQKIKIFIYVWIFQEPL